MTEREIRLGDTNSFRYIGIQPPISDTIADLIMNTLRLPDWIYPKTDATYTQSPTGTTVHSRYTEFGFYVGLGEDLRQKSSVDHTTIELARQIVKILEGQGDVVHLDTEIIPTDFQTPMFCEEADQMRKTIRILTTRHV